VPTGPASNGAAFVSAFSQSEKSDEGNYVISVDAFSFRDEPGIQLRLPSRFLVQDMFDYVEPGSGRKAAFGKRYRIAEGGA
jgi:hypothetical protein